MSNIFPLSNCGCMFTFNLQLSIHLNVSGEVSTQYDRNILVNDKREQRKNCRNKNLYWKWIFTYRPTTNTV